MCRMNEQSAPKQRFRFPFAVVGALVGVIFVQRWPGQDEPAMILEVLTCIGGGALAGEAIRWVDNHCNQ